MHTMNGPIYVQAPDGIHTGIRYFLAISRSLFFSSSSLNVKKSRFESYPLALHEKRGTNKIEKGTGKLFYELHTTCNECPWLYLVCVAMFASRCMNCFCFIIILSLHTGTYTNLSIFLKPYFFWYCGKRKEKHQLCC